ncbi:MAG: hypothetical protein U9Q94_08720 [Candidatus Bipolaricaulota bacterium]|nr:hypothetical protein [Candidatus Bipolaricaulota bacterium]
MVSLDDITKNFEESGSIVIAKEDTRAHIATVVAVVDSTFVFFQLQQSRHRVHGLSWRILRMQVWIHA